MTWWKRLTDPELQAELVERGVMPVDARRVVSRRDSATYAAVLASALGVVSAHCEAGVHERCTDPAKCCCRCGHSPLPVSTPEPEGVSDAVEGDAAAG